MKYQEAFKSMDESLGLFLNEVESKPLSSMATEQWTVKDLLCHITSWHERYAANYRSAAYHLKPEIPQGPTQKLNHDGVRSLHRLPKKTLLTRLRKADKVLYDAIVIKQMPEMTYKKGGRVYETNEFLNMIARHILTHAKQVRRAKIKS